MNKTFMIDLSHKFWLEFDGTFVRLMMPSGASDKLHDMSSPQPGFISFRTGIHEFIWKYPPARLVELVDWCASTNFRGHATLMYGAIKHRDQTSTAQVPVLPAAVALPANQRSVAREQWENPNYDAFMKKVNTAFSECQECWGTGYRNGFGAHCSKGCKS